MNNIDQIFSRDPIKFAEDYLRYLNNVLQGIDLNEIGQFINILLNARSSGAQIFFMGNGGSAATASHFANDLSIGTDSYEKPFKAISIVDNHAIVTAIANDFGYSEIFSRQLRVLASAGDVVVAISASGNSPNLINAIEYANSKGMETVAITAFDGGALRKLCNHGVHVPTGLKEYGPAEDAHMILDHLIGAYLLRLLKSHD
ncbi:GmhA Phosphoheptose isomerase [Burkholderiaceae bacterium]